MSISPPKKQTSIKVSAKNAALKKSPSKMNSKKRLYLAGPIRGIHNFKERFAHATYLLRHAGYNVFNPVEQDDFFLRVGLPNDIALYLEHDLAWVCRWAQVVGLLPGWDESDGARAEYYAARACGKETWVLPEAYTLHD